MLLRDRRPDRSPAPTPAAASWPAATPAACEVSNNRVVRQLRHLRRRHPRRPYRRWSTARRPTPTASTAVPNMHHNWMAQNGATEAGGGGGITLGTGSDSYVVTSNYVCGNFSMADGGGISHLGLSPDDTGNAYSAGEPDRQQQVHLQPDLQPGAPTRRVVACPSRGQIPLGGGTAAGTGDVTVDANLFQGNQAGRRRRRRREHRPDAAGNDAQMTSSHQQHDRQQRHGLCRRRRRADRTCGNGVRLVNNTVASNVSTATNRQSFGPTRSERQASTCRRSPASSVLERREPDAAEQHRLGQPLVHLRDHRHSVRRVVQPGREFRLTATSDESAGVGRPCTDVQRADGCCPVRKLHGQQRAA